MGWLVGQGVGGGGEVDVTVIDAASLNRNEEPGG